jgi:phosphatidate cytidylyltransferase
VPQHTTEPAGIKKKSFITRTITSFVYAAVFLTCVILGNGFFVLPLFCAVLAFMGCREFFKITSPDMNRVPRFIGTFLGISLPLIAAVAMVRSHEIPILGTGGLAGLIALFYAVMIGSFALMMWAAFTPTSTVKDSSLSLFGALYLGVPLASLVLIRELEGGIFFACMTVVGVWAADSLAYLGGSLFGRHKIAPVISPKKSWEGFFAGILGSVIAWIVMPLIMGIEFNLFASVVIGVVAALAAFVGDLFESRMKREACVKDSGDILPGHGGILDRIDSMLAVATLLFLILSIAGHQMGIAGL